MMTVEEIVKKAKADGASDIHIVMGLPVKYRLDGQLVSMNEDVMSADDCIAVAEMLAGDNYDVLEREGELDAAASFDTIRCRIHIFKAQGIPSTALRILSERIPELDNLGIPEAAKKVLDRHKGIVLITGETGSGKSTTLAAMLDKINHTRREHIVTLEDPVEYLYTPDLCTINQREVGKDTMSFASGLRASLREDPNVILIGEMRDRDTIETAITAAETGHLVFGTLHTGTASDSIDRMVQVFPEGAQNQIRLQLSMVLVAVLTQQLLPRIGGGRVLACEYMTVTDAIRNLIRSGNTPQIANAVATSAAIGGQTMDQALVKLIREKKITRDTAMLYAHDAQYIKKNVG